MNRPIERVDVDTYNVPSETSEGIDYLVFNSWRIGWTCTCMSWQIHSKHKAPHPECKHIKLVKKTFIKQKV